ncbi:MAG: SlyX family protein [Desulfuromonadaceae bacterium]
MSDKQMVELESRIAFQEYQIEELSSQISEQQKQILELEALCRSIAKRLKSGAVASEDPETEINERPPHY